MESSKRIRKTFDMKFSCLEEKDQFLQRWDDFRKRNPDLENVSSAMSYLLSREKWECGKVFSNDVTFNYNSFVSINRERSKHEALFICCPQSIQSLIEAVYKLGKLYHHKKGTVTSQLEQFSNFVATFTIRNVDHTFKWKSSPYIEGTSKFFVNEKVACGIICSGIVSSYFHRFTIASRLGNMSSSFIMDVVKRISPAVSEVASDSMNKAVDESEDLSDNKMTLETNTCVSAYQYSQRSTTFALCHSSHMIIANKIKSTKDPDSPPVQDHEKISTNEILKELGDRGKQVRCIVHDSNKSVSEDLRQNFPNIKDQNCVWLKIKDSMAGFSKLTKGSQKTENIKWHPQLKDKYEGVKNHFWYSVMHSGNDAEFLIDSLDAIVLHYQGEHENCRLSSPCVRNSHYAPSRVLLTDPKAVKLLADYITNTPIYKNPTVLLEGLTTSHVDAAKLALRSFLPKRQSFGDVSFQLRINLFILDWNENANRGFTKQTDKTLAGTLSENSGRKYYKKKSYEYTQKIWEQFLQQVPH